MTEKFSGRSESLRDTPLGRLYRRLYVHPSRFHGDLQGQTGIVNNHERLQQFVASFPKGARLLDLGSGSRRLQPDALASDIRVLPGVGVVADAHALPFADGVFDGIVAQMLLEHVGHPERVLAEIHRILKQRGRLFCEVPFLYPVHDRVDYRRWSLAGLELACRSFERIDSGVSIGPFAALSVMLRQIATHRLRSVKLEAAAELVVGFLLSPLKFLDDLLPRRTAEQLVAGAVYFEGFKA